MTATETKSAHCHGCGRYTAQESTAGHWACQVCGFENARLHEVTEVGDKVYRWLKCNDCGEHAR